MASIPPTELPVPSNDPIDPGSTPPEFTPPSPDVDLPDAGVPAGDPGTSQPTDL